MATAALKVLSMHTSISAFGVCSLASLLAGIWLGRRYGCRAGLMGLTTVFVAAALAAHGILLCWEPIGFGFDVSQYHNTLWNLTNGRWTECQTIGQPLYSVHPLFTLPLYLPFYWMSEDMAPLNLAHLLFGLSAIWPLYNLALKDLESREAAVAVSLIYLLLPSTSGFLFVECQSSITGIPFFFAYLYCRRIGRTLLAVLWATLASFAWEPFLAAVIMEGMKEMFLPRSGRRLGFGVLMAGMMTLLLYVLNKQGYFDVSSSRHYTDLGGSPWTAMTLLWSDPVRLLEHVATGEKIGYLAHLLFPLLALPLLAPSALWVALPEVTLVLLSNRGDDMNKINCFYNHVATVAVLWGTLTALRRLRAWYGWPVERTAFVILLHVLCLQAVYHHGFLRTAAMDIQKVMALSDHPRAQTISYELVPEGSRVLTSSRSQLPLFPRRAATVADEFLAPRVHAAWARREMSFDFLVVSSGEDLDRHIRADEKTDWVLVASNAAGVDMYARDKR